LAFRDAMLSAKPPSTEIEVEVIGMGGVVVGGEDAAEPLARAVADATQKFLFVGLTIPTFQQGDAATIREAKTCDVDGFGAGVFAPAI